MTIIYSKQNIPAELSLSVKMQKGYICVRFKITSMAQRRLLKAIEAKVAIS